MIGYFPKIYPDELVYSYLARIGVYNGYLIYRQLSEDIYDKIKYVPSVEFIDRLKPEVQEHLIGSGTFEDIILGHTMFPFYAGFLDEERKREAIKFLEEGNGEYYKAIPMPKKRKARYIRFCPLCVEADRKQYGEAYWHTVHQMQGIDVCYKHGCILVDSELKISADSTVKLVTAEEAPKEAVEIVMGSDKQTELAKYVVKVMRNINEYPDKSISAFLNYNLIGTKYLSKRGDHKYISNLCKDFVDYYKEMDDVQSVDVYRSRLINILKGKRVDFLEICQLAMLLGITADELIKCEVDKGFSSEQYTRDFDAKVLELLSEGVGINEISRRFSISSKTTRDIRDNNYKMSNHSFKGRAGKKIADWNKLDRELLPDVYNAIERIKNETEERPVRLTKSSVCRVIGVSYERFLNCPHCVDAVSQHYEPFDKYWARELVWAIRKLQKENKEIHITNIMKMTNMRKQNVIDGVECITDKKYKEIVEGCLV